MGMERVSSWRRGSLLGAGAFGEVNLALDTVNGELFAVKSVEVNERTSSETQAIENEVQILEGLNSPFVVKCLGSSFSVENGKTMRNVFMEYMPGGSVADLLKKFGGHIDEPVIRKYTRSLLEGIRYLHSQKIVHCDIKGKNVLVGSSGLKLADFGGARSVESGAAAVVNVKGTPLWMAPEVARQEEQGPPSDIWSLGCTVVEMATGRAPWSNIASATNLFVALYHIGCSEEVPDLPSCLSEEGKDFLSKCFRRDPRVRWTADQLLQHPFITDCVPAEQEKPKPPASPTSVYDFPSHSIATACYTSSIANSVPILKSPVFARRKPEQTSNFATDTTAAESRASSTTPDFWCAFPQSPLPEQWIVVRSPKSTAPSSVSSPSPSPSSPFKLTNKFWNEESAPVVPAIDVLLVSQEESEVKVAESASAASNDVSVSTVEVDVCKGDVKDEVHEEESFHSREKLVERDSVQTIADAASDLQSSYCLVGTITLLVASRRLETCCLASADNEEPCLRPTDGDARSMDSRKRRKQTHAPRNPSLQDSESAHRRMNSPSTSSRLEEVAPAQRMIKHASLSSSLQDLDSAHRKLSPVRDRPPKLLQRRVTFGVRLHTLIGELSGRCSHALRSTRSFYQNSLHFLHSRIIVKPQFFIKKQIVSLQNCLVYSSFRSLFFVFAAIMEWFLSFVHHSHSIHESSFILFIHLVQAPNASQSFIGFCGFRMAVMEWFSILRASFKLDARIASFCS